MSDLSVIFKATVKSLKLKSSGDVNEALGLKKTNKTASIKQCRSSNLSEEAKLIVSSITKLNEHLSENKKIYIQPNYLTEENDAVTDEDRIHFENETESLIKRCSEAIHSFKARAFAQCESSQYSSHLESLFLILEAYLKEVCKIYSEQKAVQVKRAIEKRNFSQLYKPTFKPLSSIVQEELESKREDEPPITLTKEEIQAFELENESLFDNLTLMTQDIKHIESQVIEISRLQKTFTEKLLEQDLLIESIQESAAQSTDNIKDGNEEIQEAMRKNGAIRLWILFIVIVLSFTLIFLDWYNE